MAKTNDVNPVPCVRCGWYTANPTRICYKCSRRDPDPAPLVDGDDFDGAEGDDTDRPGFTIFGDLDLDDGLTSDQRYHGPGAPDDV